MKSYSLTRRLITMVLLVELASALCVSGVALIYERHTHFRSFDVLLRGRADSLLGAVQDAEDAGDNVMLDGSESSLPADDIWEVRTADGRVVGKSANWRGSESLMLPEKHKDRNPVLPSQPGQQEAHYTTSVNHERYRVIRIGGLRVVDPGDKDGGIRRYVTVYYGSAVDRVWGAILRTVAFYAGSSVLVLAVTALLMSWLLNRGLAPLRDLASAASSVSVASWPFSPPDSARSTRELEPLVNALETLLAGLQQSFEKQKRFVGDAAHELKTGVAVVKSSIQLLNMKPRTQTDYQAGLERCLDDCKRMEELVSQMLTLARIEEETTSPGNNSVTDVTPAIQELLLQLEPMAESKRIPILVHGAESLASAGGKVCVEPVQFKLLLSNLLMNALQHSPDESTIRIDVKAVSGFAELEIRDTGDGIDPSYLPTIFDRFSRSDPSRSRHTGGTGLGLAICKAITDRFRGTIEVVSELNRGTVVIVRLPFAKG